MLRLLLLSLLLCVSPAFASGGHHDDDDLEEIPDVMLTQEDFKYGTYIINSPGRYVLTENISFNPNSAATLNALPQATKDILTAQAGLSFPVDAYQASSPLPTQFSHGTPDTCMPCDPTQRRYDPRGFGLGFFAAIVVAAKDVEIDLNGFTLEQSEEHALLQRFYANIELAEQPFIPAQGPADFGSDIVSGKRVLIHNGTLGRSAHHGIHGNGNKRIRVRDVDFKDYEVAAVALNGVKGLRVSNVRAENRKDVPVLGTFSSIQFIKPYINELFRNGVSTTLNVDGATYTVADIRNALRDAVNNVHYDIVTSNLDSIDAAAHPEEYALFHNKFGVVDGNSYSFLVNALGVAVDGFPTRPESFEDAKDSNWAYRVNFHDVHVLSQHAFINEIVALNQGGKAAIDPVGAVFQTRNLHPDTGVPLTMTSLNPATARYIGNVAANAQAFVAKASLAGDFAGSHLDLSRLNITQAVLDWVEAKPGSETLSAIVQSGSDYFCNGDSMFHVNKGVIGFKLDAAFSIDVKQTSVTNLKNFGAEGSSACGNYLDGKSHPAATYDGYGGAVTRAYTFAGSGEIEVADSVMSDIGASSGTAVGIDLFDSFDAKIRDTYVDGVDAASATNVGDYNDPNAIPEAVGFKVGPEAKRSRIKRSCAENMEGVAGETIISDESGRARTKRICP